MKTPALTELEDRLASPQGMAVRDELSATLQALESRLRADMAKGLSRDSYGMWQAAADAARAAQQVLARQPMAAHTIAASPVPAPFSSSPPI